MTLNGPFFLPKRKISRRLGTKMYSSLIFMHGYKPKFVLFFLFCSVVFFFYLFIFFLRLPVPNLLLAPFLSFFSPLLLSLPFAFHIFFLAAVKSWVLIMGKAWIWDLVCTKTVTLFFSLLCQKAVDLV